MKNWKESDKWKVIVYKRELGLEKMLINEEVAIYDVNPKIPNTLRVVECPIPLDNYPISLNSKIGITGIVRDQEKNGEEYLEKAGDWYFKRYASKEEIEVLKKVAKDLKVYSD